MKKTKVSIPKELKLLWKKDYYELTSEQRKLLTDFFINHLQQVQFGLIEKLKPPFFMTQEDILKKEEDVKMNIEIVKEREKKQLEKEMLRQSHKAEWFSKSLFQLEEIEKIRLENYQLKLELIEKALKEVTNKKEDVLKAQILYATKLEEKYNIVFDDYAIDLVSGRMLRNPKVEYKELNEEELEKLEKL